MAGLTGECEKLENNSVNQGGYYLKFGKMAVLW